MRTTLDLDEDVLLAIKERGRREGRSAGQVLSDLARQALTRGPVGTEIAEGTGVEGFEPLPRRGPAVSNALVEALREEEGE